MLAFLCCGVELGDGKLLLEVRIYGRLQDEHRRMEIKFTIVAVAVFI